MIAVMMRPVSLLCALCIAAVALLGCDLSPPNNSGLVFRPDTESSHMTDTLIIRMGESATRFAARAGSRLKVARQPAGIDFYAINWLKPPRGTVRLERGKHTIDIEQVFSALTAEDQEELKSEGLFKFSVNAGVSAPEFISHDEARLAIHAILRRILDAGWQQVIERDEPRLRGQARLDHMFATTNSSGLDAAFVPTLTDWMRIPSRTAWNFYADGVYLDVSFTREPTYTDAQKPGAYLLTFNLQTETEYFRGYAGPDNRLRWEEFVQPELDKAAAQRASKEAELVAQGVRLDLSYRDPPVPPWQ